MLSNLTSSVLIGRSVVQFKEQIEVLEVLDDRLPVHGHLHSRNILRALVWKNANKIKRQALESQPQRLLSYIVVLLYAGGNQTDPMSDFSEARGIMEVTAATDLE